MRHYIIVAIIMIMCSSCSFITSRMIIHKYCKHNGEIAKSFDAYNLNDSLVCLDKYKGNVIYLTFGELACGATQSYVKSIPNLINKYKNFDSIVFINVIIEKDKVKWRDFIKSNNIQGVNFVFTGDRDYLRELYKIDAVPMEIVIDKNYKIQGTDLCGLAQDAIPYFALYGINAKKGFKDLFKVMSYNPVISSYANDMMLTGVDSTYKTHNARLYYILRDKKNETNKEQKK